MTETGVITKLSRLSVADTVAKFTAMISAKGIKLFAVIDQAAGTPVMAAAPLAALDLPLKVLIWSDDGQTNVSYYAPDALAARHHIPADLVGNLGAINGLTDALTASA
jgi:uncharacterized protein (DUF302 family)